MSLPISRWCFATTVLQLIAPGPVSAQGGEGSQDNLRGAITGVVFDQSTNTPITNARITLRSATDSASHRSVRTDAGGDYFLTDITFGQYIFSVARLGYARIDLDVLVDRTAPLSISIGLSPEPVHLPSVNVESESDLPMDRLRASGPSVTGRHNTLDAAEIQGRGLGHQNAYSIIRRLRPGWLVARGEVGTAGMRGNNQIVLYVNGVRRGVASDARSIEGNTISRIFLFDAIEATQRWGTGHVNGAIHILLKPPAG